MGTRVPADYEMVSGPFGGISVSLGAFSFLGANQRDHMSKTKKDKTKAINIFFSIRLVSQIDYHAN